MEPEVASGSVSEGYLNPFQILDLVSPTAWLNQGILEVTGFDVLGSIVKPFFGDWEAFSRFGGALRNLSYTMQDMGANIQLSLDVLDSRWDGKASDAAYNYFAGLAAQVSGTQHVLREAAANYEKTATGVWEIAQQTANVLQSIVDQGIIMVISAAAGTALVETGVGFIAGWAVATLEAVDMWRLFNRALILVQTAGQLILTFFGFIQQVNWRFGDLATYPLPGSAYDHPAVSS